MRVDKIALIAMVAAICAALFGCAAQETAESVSEPVASSETSAEAGPTPTATPEPLWRACYLLYDAVWRQL